MHPLLLSACAQADNCIASALERPCPVPSRLSPRGTVANPAPRALQLDEKALMDRLSLSESWFDGVSAAGGFLNFTLSPSWYQAAAEQTPKGAELPPFSPVCVNFPAKTNSFDWLFLEALRGKAPSPALAARQDRENPGWLVRYTLRRLRTLAPRSPRSLRWTEPERELMRTLAQFDPHTLPRKQADYLRRLSKELWKRNPRSLPALLNRHAGAVLACGCTALLHGADLQKIHPSAEKL